MIEIQIRLIRKEDSMRLLHLIENNRQRLLPYFNNTCHSIQNIETAQKFVKIKMNQAFLKEQYYFVIELKTTLEIVGIIILKNINWWVPKGELAYFIDEAFEGRGFATHAVKWVIEYAFEVLKFKKLYLKCTPENIGSKRIAEKCGFEKEGHLNSEFRNGHGVITDLERFGLIK